MLVLSQAPHTDISLPLFRALCSCSAECLHWDGAGGGWRGGGQRGEEVTGLKCETPQYEERDKEPCVGLSQLIFIICVFINISLELLIITALHISETLRYCV